MNQQAREKAENLEQQQRDDAKRTDTPKSDARQHGVTGPSTDE